MENTEEVPTIEITLKVGNELDLLNLEGGLIDAIYTISSELRNGTSFPGDPIVDQRAYWAISTAAELLEQIHSWRIEPSSQEILLKLRELDGAEASSNPGESGSGPLSKNG